MSEPSPKPTPEVKGRTTLVGEQRQRLIRERQLAKPERSPPSHCGGCPGRRIVK